MAGPWGYRAAVRNRVPEADLDLLVGGRIAGGGARTHTILRSLDFESSASASSATPAGEGYRSALRARGASEKLIVRQTIARVQRRAHEPGRASSRLSLKSARNAVLISRPKTQSDHFGLR